MEIRQGSPLVKAGCTLLARRAAKPTISVGTLQFLLRGWSPTAQPGYPA